MNNSLSPLDLDRADEQLASVIRAGGADIKDVYVETGRQGTWHASSSVVIVPSSWTGKLRLQRKLREVGIAAQVRSV